jgi:hypothetical protein
MKDTDSDVRVAARMFCRSVEVGVMRQWPGKCACSFCKF